MPDIDLSLKGSKRVARQRVAVARREAAEPPQDAKSGVAPLAGNRPRDPIPIAIDTLEKQLATLAE